MVAHFTMRTYGVNQVFRFVEGIEDDIERDVKSYFFFEITYFIFIRAQHILSHHLV